MVVGVRWEEGLVLIINIWNQSRRRRIKATVHFNILKCKSVDYSSSLTKKLTWELSWEKKKKDDGGGQILIIM